MLTDTQCRNAKAKAAPYKLTDAKGLYLEVKPSGARTWRYRFELGAEGARKESVFTIGEYACPGGAETAEQAKARHDGGRFTLAEARDARTKARGLVKQGINPADDRKLARVKRAQDANNTVEALADEWLALKDWEQHTKDNRRAMLKRAVFPKIGALPIKQVTPAHVLDVLQSAATNNGPSVAAEAQRTLSGIFDRAVATLRADNNPVYPVRKALPPNKTQHRRPLAIAEIGALLRDLDGYERNFQTVAVFRLMWLTLCRPNEVIGARWSEFDLDAALWRIPAERMKKRKEHLVPLSRQAVDVLRSMHAQTGHREHTFPHRDDRTKHMTDHTLRMALKMLGWSTKYSPHATRTTGSTRLNEMGFASDWIERQLAHAEPNAVRRTYNHAEYLGERAKMMQQWADMLDTWRDGGKVVALRSAVA